MNLIRGALFVYNQNLPFLQHFATSSPPNATSISLPRPADPFANGLISTVEVTLLLTPSFASSFPRRDFRPSITLLWSGCRLYCTLSLEPQLSHKRETNMAVHSLPTLLIALFIQSTWSQQLQGPAMGMPYNLSVLCTQALNTSVACPGALADVAAKWAPSSP